MGHSAGLQTTLGVSLMEIMGPMLAAAPENWLPGLGSSCTSPRKTVWRRTCVSTGVLYRRLNQLTSATSPGRPGLDMTHLEKCGPELRGWLPASCALMVSATSASASYGAKPAIRQTPESGIRDVPEVGVRPHDGLGSDIAPTVSIQAHSLVRPFASAWCGSSKRSTNLPAVGPIATPVSGTSSPLSKQQGVLSQFSRNEPPARR